MKGARPLTDLEVKAVLKALVGPRDRALFVLGIRSGFRISELLSLTLRDVAPLGPVLVAVAVKRRNMKGKEAGRTVPLHQEARRHLRTWIGRLRGLGHTAPETFVFRSRKGGNRAIDAIQAWRRLTAAYRTAGLAGRLGSHAMRKTFANRVYERLHHDLVKTQQAMGHKDVNSTVAYLSFKQEDIDAAILGD